MNKNNKIIKYYLLLAIASLYGLILSLFGDRFFSFSSDSLGLLSLLQIFSLLLLVTSIFTIITIYFKSTSSISNIIIHNLNSNNYDSIYGTTQEIEVYKNKNKFLILLNGKYYKLEEIQNHSKKIKPTGDKWSLKTQYSITNNKQIDLSISETKDKNLEDLINTKN